MTRTVPPIGDPASFPNRTHRAHVFWSNHYYGYLRLFTYAFLLRVTVDLHLPPFQNALMSCTAGVDAGVLGSITTIALLRVQSARVGIPNTIYLLQLTFELLCDRRLALRALGPSPSSLRNTNVLRCTESLLGMVPAGKSHI